MDPNLDLLTIALLPAVGPRAVRELSRRAALQEVLSHPDDFADALPPGARHQLRSGQAQRYAADELARAAAAGITIRSWDDPDYPALLRETYDPPPVLWSRGNPGSAAVAVAIVGSRVASPQGRTFARALARDLAAAGVTIVSGLARGIDTAAHQGALDGGGHTVAVLGSGLDRLYPRENEGLAAAIAERGAVVSEFPLGTAPLPGHFPRRNRLIAGWGRAVVVVEAAGRSGALSTARSALEEGREVMAVPGHPGQPQAEGTNQLIRDGAVLVRHAADVAQELGLNLAPSAPAPQDELLATLRYDVPLSLDELQARSGRPITELLTRLAELELSGGARRLPGPLFVRA